MAIRSKKLVLLIAVCTYFASSTRAMVADSNGADALVPVNPSVQPLFKSVVTCSSED